MFWCENCEGREAINEVMDQVYPHVRENPRLRKLIEQSPASVVYHERFLREVMPRNHPLFRTELFIHEGYLDTLKKWVTAEAHGRVPVGITPHTSIMQDMAELKGQVMEMKNLMMTTAGGRGATDGDHPSAGQGYNSDQNGARACEQYRDTADSR